MRQYSELIEETWRRAGSASDLSDASDHAWLMSIFSPRFLEQCRGYLQQARSLADTPAIRDRVAFVEDGLRYVELTMAAVAKSQQ